MKTFDPGTPGADDEVAVEAERQDVNQGKL
jgi:hypothetical protein